MNTFIDRQLTQIKVQEMLQEAAEARADRKAQTASTTRNIFGGLFFLLILTPVVFLIFRYLLQAQLV